MFNEQCSFSASLPCKAKEPGLDTSMEEAGMEALGQMGRVQQVTSKRFPNMYCKVVHVQC